MPNIENFVDVNVTLGAIQAAQASFDTALILAASAATPFGADRVRVYDSMTAVATDFPSGDVFTAASLYFGQANVPSALYVGAIKEADATPVAALQAVIAVNNDWYGIILLDQTKADVLAFAAYVETLTKIFITSSADTNILSSSSSTDVAAELMALNYARTACLYSASATSYPEAGWMGLLFALADAVGIGSVNWNFKTIVGIAADNLTDTQYANAIAKNCNVYVPVGGVSIATPGFMAGGLFIDLKVGADSLQSDQQTEVFNLFLAQPKVAYTNKGITQIENVVHGNLQDYVDNGFLVPGSIVITVPDASEIPGSTKQTRVFSSMTWSAELAGAINKTTINGTLSF